MIHHKEHMIKAYCCEACQESISKVSIYAADFWCRLCYAITNNPSIDPSDFFEDDKDLKLFEYYLRFLEKKGALITHENDNLDICIYLKAQNTPNDLNYRIYCASPKEHGNFPSF